MKQRLAGIFLTVILLFALGPPRVSGLLGTMSHPQATHPAEATRQPEYKSGRILVKFRPETPRREADNTLNAHGLAASGRIYGLEVYRVPVPEGQEPTLVEALSQNPRVEYAELDYLVQATIIPNDTYYQSTQWAPPKIEAPAAWDQMCDTSNIVIAIVDTGVDLDHPDLDGKIVDGWNFIDDNEGVQDDHGHGTHVAGIAAAETNNGIGVAGIGWDAGLMPVKVLNGEGTGSTSDVAAGIGWACDHGASIINMSLGGSTGSPSLEEAVQQAYDDGCLMTAAAGNDGEQNGVDYPAAYPETIAVAATDQDDHQAYFSDSGPEVDVAAPGVDIYSTVWSDTYDLNSGTSMAAPHVAGLAALVWSLDPGLTNAEVQSIIETTAEDLGPPGWDSRFGFGRINAAEALDAVTPVSTLALNKNELIFLADATIVTSPQTVLVTDGRSCGTFGWSASESASWLYLDPEEGISSPSEPGEITVWVVDETGLEQGNTYLATIEIAATTPGVLESPQMVDVTFVYTYSLESTFFPLAMRNSN